MDHDSVSTSDKSDRDKIIDALLALLAERRIERISLADVARRAEVPLAQCRAQFDSLLSVLAAFTKRIDQHVLNQPDDGGADESPRERLFDILMRRFEALTPHREAIRSLARSASCNPGLALALNGLALRSQQWMLEAAGISTSGLRGVVRAQGTACLYANAMRTWLDDDDPGLARTMARLDRELGRGARWSECLDSLCRMLPRPPRRRRRRSYDDRDYGNEQPAVI